MTFPYVAVRPLTRNDNFYFKIRPDAAFRLRDPLPGEFTAAELARPNAGSPVCFVLRHGVLLRWRLPPRQARDAGLAISIINRIRKQRGKAS